MVKWNWQKSRITFPRKKEHVVLFRVCLRLACEARFVTKL